MRMQMPDVRFPERPERLVMALLLLAGVAHVQAAPLVTPVPVQKTMVATAQQKSPAMATGSDEDATQKFIDNKRMAESGNAMACFNLGVMYFKGIGTQKSLKQGIANFHRAADQGLVQAQFNLGLIYRDGNGVAQDYRQAIGWFRKAAEQGYLEAQHHLGLMYFNHMGVPRDHEQAHMWLNLASIEGNEASIKYRKILESEMTLEQVLKAQAMARDWMARHKEPNH